MRVLIVEDEIRIREGIRKLLSSQREEYQVVGEAEDGEEGVKLCLELDPDIIITDIRMPNMDGLQMLSELSEKHCRAKAVVLSAYSEFEYARQAMKHGVTEYLLKPISLSDFSQAMQNVKKQVQIEEQKKPAQIGTLEQTLRDIIDGRMNVSDEVKRYLSNNCAIPEDASFSLICVYLGNDFKTQKAEASGELRHTLSTFRDARFCILEDEPRKSLTAVV